MVPTVNDYQELQQSDRNVKIVDGSLIIKNIQKNHEGYYLCKASNGIGGISAVAKISVQGMYEFFPLSEPNKNIDSLRLEINTSTAEMFFSFSSNFFCSSLAVFKELLRTTSKPEIITK